MKLHEKLEELKAKYQEEKAGLCVKRELTPDMRLHYHYLDGVLTGISWAVSQPVISRREILKKLDEMKRGEKKFGSSHNESAKRGRMTVMGQIYILEEIWGLGHEIG